MVSRGLIVVGVQNDFCDGGSIPVQGGARIAARIADLVEQTAGRDYQYVVATRDHHIDPGGHFSQNPDFEHSFPVHCVAGDEGSEFHPHFVPAVTGGIVDAVFFKGAHSASERLRGSRRRRPPSRTGRAPAGSRTSTWWASPRTTACVPPRWTP
jgi:nicotinamidase/pyrazinamidase